MKLFNTRLFTRPHRTTKGFTLLEFIVVIIVIALLFTLAMSYLLKFQVAAEQTSFKKLTSEMRAALKLQVISYYAKGRMQEILNLVGSNPLDYASEIPESYIGEQPAPDLTMLPQGSWIYDTTKKILIYRVLNSEYFSTELTGIKRIELKISLIYADINQNKQFNQAVDSIEGLRLISSHRYTWQINK